MEIVEFSHVMDVPTEWQAEWAGIQEMIGLLNKYDPLNQTIESRFSSFTDKYREGATTTIAVASGVEAHQKGFWETQDEYHARLRREYFKGREARFDFLINRYFKRVVLLQEGRALHVRSVRVGESIYSVPAYDWVGIFNGVRPPKLA